MSRTGDGRAAHGSVEADACLIGLAQLNRFRAGSLQRFRPPQEAVRSGTGFAPGRGGQGFLGWPQHVGMGRVSSTLALPATQAAAAATRRLTQPALGSWQPAGSATAVHVGCVFSPWQGGRLAALACTTGVVAATRHRGCLRACASTPNYSIFSGIPGCCDVMYIMPANLPPALRWYCLPHIKRRKWHARASIYSSMHV